MTSNFIDASSRISSLDSSPPDIILSIADYLQSQDDILSFSSVSHHLRNALSPLAFRRMAIYGFPGFYKHRIWTDGFYCDPELQFKFPPAIRPFITELVLRLDVFSIDSVNLKPAYQWLTRRDDKDDPDTTQINPCTNFEAVRSLRVVLPTEYSSGGSEERRNIGKQGAHWHHVISSSSIAPEFLNVEGLDIANNVTIFTHHLDRFPHLCNGGKYPFHLDRCVPGFGSRPDSLRLVITKLRNKYIPSWHDQDKRVCRLFQVWISSFSTTLKKLELACDFYADPVHLLFPSEGAGFKHLRQLILKRITFTTNDSACFFERMILSDEVAATLEELTLIQCPIMVSGDSGTSRTWSIILTKFRKRLGKLRMFRPDKRLGYKMRPSPYYEPRRQNMEDEVYLADVQALLWLWAKIGQTPRFTDAKRLVHLFH